MEQLSFLFPEGTTGSNNKTAKKNEYVLWNGEYGWHDLGYVNGLEGILINQKRTYPNYIGMVVGDFTCLEVEYDWGKRDQRWKVQCNLCGEETYRYHTRDWLRGKGSKQVCHCRKDKEMKEIQRIREEQRLGQEKRIQEEIGKEYGKWRVIEYKGNKSCKVMCLQCGAIRKDVDINRLKDGAYVKCECEMAKYGDPKWIGKRVGHLATVSHEGHNFVCKCDCGRERIVLDTFFAQKRYRNCGIPGCEYMTDQTSAAIAARIRGNNYEAIAKGIVMAGGYDVQAVGKTGDYGVDLIATDIYSGKQIAIQCKSNTVAQIGVGAVQEVYAGGRYYGLERFAVIGHSGYSKQAVNMAKKLGVYLCDGEEFAYPEDIEKYANELIPTVKAHKNIKARKLYEVDGKMETLSNIAYEYKVKVHVVRDGLKRGLTIENAIKYAKEHENAKEKNKYTVNGISGTLKELCDHFGVVKYPCALYRVNNGMSVEEAILTEKLPQGRPKKQKDGNELAVQERMAI